MVNEPTEQSRPLHAIVVINRNSGAKTEADTIAERACSALQQRGCHVDTHLVSADELGDVLANVAVQRPDILTVGGGDGTICAGAETAINCGATLSIIPMGTMNLLAHDLDIPLEPIRACRVLADGNAIPIDVGNVNGRFFLHSSVLGLVPNAGQWREKVRKADNASEQIQAMFQTAYAAMSTPSIQLKLRTGDWERHVQSFSLAVTNNLIDEDISSGFKRSTLTGGRLGVYLMEQQGPIGRLSMLFSLGSGVWKIDPEVATGACTSLTVDSDDGSLLVSNDGEIAFIDCPLEYSTKPRALRVLVPSPD